MERLERASVEVVSACFELSVTQTTYLRPRSATHHLKSHTRVTTTCSDAVVDVRGRAEVRVLPPSSI